MRPTPLNAEFFLLHNGTTTEDIKTILAGKQKILPLLGQARKEFGAEYWSGGDDFNEFKIYITGMGGKILTVLFVASLTLTPSKM